MNVIEQQQNFKNHMIVSVYTEKEFDKIYHLFMLRNVQHSRDIESIPQCKKGHIWQIHSQHHTQQNKKPKSILFKINKKTGTSTFTTLV